MIILQGGWFEFNTIYSLGGEQGETAVTQEACTGEVGGTAPFASTNHIARFELALGRSAVPSHLPPPITSPGLCLHQGGRRHCAICLHQSHRQV